MTHEQVNKDLRERAEEYADSKERRGCSYWSGLKEGYIAGASEVSAEKDRRIDKLQESEMRLMDANSRQERRIEELFLKLSQYERGF